jgi:hypothetical protein
MKGKLMSWCWAIQKDSPPIFSYLSIKNSFHKYPFWLSFIPILQCSSLLFFHFLFFCLILPFDLSLYFALKRGNSRNRTSCSSKQTKREKKKRKTKVQEIVRKKKNKTDDKLTDLSSKSISCRWSIFSLSFPVSSMCL